MKITISFKNLKHTPALDLRIKEKSAHLNKFFEEESTRINWVCYVKEGVHYAEVSLHGLHKDYHATAKADNLYKTFDLAVSKLEKQLAKKKDKVKNKLHKNRRGTEIVILDPEMAWTDQDEDVA
jgi:putative sigma-54 modulation protein